MEKEKLQALATAIRAVFDQDDQDITIFANDKLPRGYLRTIKQQLPPGYQWPKDESNLSRLIVQNKPNILKILREAFNVDNTTTLSSDIVERFIAKPEHVEHSEASERLTREEVSGMITEAIKRISSEDAHFFPNTKNHPLFQIVHRKPGRKRKDATGGREWEKLQTSVDKRLFEMFCAEAEERRLNRSKMLDLILSERYGCKTD